jgi:hypothetical protein
LLDKKHSKQIENIVVRTFERYAKGDATYTDDGADSNHLGCCQLPTDVIRMFAGADMKFSTFIFRAEQPKVRDSSFLRALDLEN